VLVLGIWLGAFITQDEEYHIPIPPTTDISCLPCTIPAVITHSNDPCGEDEVQWWTSVHTRTCVPLDEICIDLVEAYK
jgi:hypothetical protein